jgi:hypothetical protein
VIKREQQRNAAALGRFVISIRDPLDTFSPWQPRHARLSTQGTLLCICKS